MEERRGTVQTQSSSGIKHMGTDGSRTYLREKGSHTARYLKLSVL
jgi:hypothetical protein